MPLVFFAVGMGVGFALALNAAVELDRRCLDFFAACDRSLHTLEDA